MKKLISLTLATLMVAGMLAGCKTSTKNPTETKPSTEASKEATRTDEVKETGTTRTDKPKVAFIGKSFSDSFCVWVKDVAVETATKDYKDEFELVTFDSENNSSKQIDQINNCVANGFDVIIFQQVDAQAPVQAVKDAVAKGVKVIVTTGHIEDNGESVYVDASPVQQGTVLAEYALTKIPQNAKVAILQGPAGNFHANGREEGYEKVLATRADIQIADKQIANWKKEEAMTITQNWISSIPDLQVIMAHNDDMALGAYEAIKMAGKEGQIQVYGIDATAPGTEAVRDGKMEATVFQNAVDYANKSLEFASKLLKGETVESTTIDSELVTKDNVEKYIELHKELGNIK